MIVWGGSGNYTGGRYDPVADSWTPTTLGTSPDARRLHTAIWDGNRMIIWGGDAAFQYMNSGGRYDPLLNTWTPTATSGAPSARSFHTAVWTGTHMVVWGGYGGSYLSTGGRYDPVEDSWTPTSTTNPPAARLNHTSIWTGSLMITWGGQPFGTGRRYDPIADSWTFISTEGEPSARTDHTATWTGSRMVIWGGSGGGLLNTGGRYDPMTDSWAPTSAINMVRRRFHTAIWTGDKILIWGGSNPSNNPSVLNSGAQYDPVTDQWTFTNLMGAPAARFHHTAVWTGSRMVVWGGTGDPGVVGTTGGRYEPVLDQWEPTSTENAPSPRSQHTAVWIGNSMVVWGGGSLLGGRYYLEQLVDHDVDGFAPCDGDCDDQNNMVFPGAPPVCDGINNDCNDPAWPALSGTNEADDDGDGSSECQTDCNDADPDIYENAPELNDGKDNQCPGDYGYGVIDETSGNSGFHDPADTDTYSWTPQEGATSYEVKRSPAPDFSIGCTGVTTSSTIWVDTKVPPPGGLFFYLNRPLTPEIGSWGLDSAGVERTTICP